MLLESSGRSGCAQLTICVHHNWVADSSNATEILSRNFRKFPFDLKLTRSRSVENYEKIFAVITTIGTTGVVAFSVPSEPPQKAAFVPAVALSKTVEAIPANTALDQPLHTIDVGAANVGIFIVHRPQEVDQGCTIEHDTLVNDKTTSIFFALDGAGTLVTGGKLANPKPIGSNDPDLKLVGSGSRGSGIQDGESRRISKGDIVIIPPGVPHGFSAIENSITYQVVRVDSGKTLPVK